MLRSTLDLIEEGILDPTIQQIEERSGIPERSIFRYFDKEELALGALALAAEELDARQGVPQLDEEQLDRRIVHLVEYRIRTLNKLDNPARAARLRASESPELERSIAQNAQRLRNDYASYFAPELDGLDVDEQCELLDAITTLLTFESYNVSRRRLGRDDATIARSWATALHRLLG